MQIKYAFSHFFFSTGKAIFWYKRNFKVSLVLQSSRNFLSPTFLFLLPLPYISFTISPRFIETSSLGKCWSEKKFEGCWCFTGANDKTSRLGWRRKIRNGQKLHIYCDFSTTLPFTNGEVDANTRLIEETRAVCLLTRLFTTMFNVQAGK